MRRPKKERHISTPSQVAGNNAAVHQTPEVVEVPDTQSPAALPVPLPDTVQESPVIASPVHEVRSSPGEHIVKSVPPTPLQTPRHKDGDTSDVALTDIEADEGHESEKNGKRHDVWAESSATPLHDSWNREWYHDWYHGAWQDTTYGTWDQSWQHWQGWSGQKYHWWNQQDSSTTSTPSPSSSIPPSRSNSVESVGRLLRANTGDMVPRSIQDELDQSVDRPDSTEKGQAEQRLPEIPEQKDHEKQQPEKKSTENKTTEEKNADKKTEETSANENKPSEQKDDDKKDDPETAKEKEKKEKKRLEAHARYMRYYRSIRSRTPRQHPPYFKCLMLYVC